MYEINLTELRDALETVGFREDDTDKFENDMGGELSIHRGYSGRGMYGRECFGIVVNNQTTTIMFFMAVREYLGLEDAIYLADSMRTDNMGYDTIVYFPKWTAIDSDDE
jgi:hypothetical protein